MTFKRDLISVIAFAAAGMLASSALADETRTITDRMGRTVEIPTEINRIATNFLPFPSAYFISTGSVDELVGIAEGSHAMASRSMFGRIAPGVLNAQTGFSRGDAINIEELLTLSPDLFVSYERNAAIQAVEQTGIPVIALDVLSQSGGNVLVTFEGWMDLLGEITEQEDRTAEIIAYARETLAKTRDRLADVPAQDRPGALFFSRLEESSLKVNGTGHFGNFWLTEAGAVNLAPEDFAPLADIDMEQIYALNPEVIFISNFSPAQPEDLYENKIPGQNWSHVAAVQNQRVYKIPEGIFQWYPPSADAPLMLRWMAQMIQPEIFADYRIEDEIKSYYDRFYGYALSEEEIQLILAPRF